MQFRSVRYLLLLVVASLSSRGLLAQTPTESLGVVVAESVLVRAAPKHDAPETQTLPSGTTLRVHHEEGDGWLAIQPPPGSLSWINHRFLSGVDKSKRFPQNGVVTSDGEVKLAAGKVGVEQPLSIRKTRIPDGTIVLVIGPPITATDEGSDSIWYPITGVRDDFRYVPKDAIRLDRPSRVGVLVHSPSSPASTTPGNLPPSRGLPADGVPAPASLATPTHPIWVQAEQAEQQGQLEKAEELYFKLAREMNATGGNPELANLCYTRIHAIRERRRTTSTATPVITPATTPVGAGAEDRPVTSTSNITQASSTREASRAGWTGAGMLRTAYQRDGRQYYALEDARGRVIVYAFSNRNQDLARYRSRTVDLFGRVSYPDGRQEIGVIEVERVDLIR